LHASHLLLAFPRPGELAAPTNTNGLPLFLERSAGVGAAN
jgi:hypothetical protein